ncbi:Putative Zn-dependent protease [Pseudomonas syringae pv. actinidiae]|uniref:Zn-dependent protease n=1 Tax=Pseudomonas syringae pv. actinidiae TaxID=103796 RepID=A0AAN4QDQ1_PSESF|nr:Putative Zn-dependent protease [Pseudomonas syringae pv. actinidiae]
MERVFLCRRVLSNGGAVIQGNSPRNILHHDDGLAAHDKCSAAGFGLDSFTRPKTLNASATWCAS